MVGRANLPCADGVATRHLEPALPWYERLLGRPPDLVPNENEVAWQVAGNGWIYLVADPDRAGRALLTLIVDDLDGHLAQLAERGLTAEGIEVLPGVGRKAEFTDPEGNRITFAEVTA